jgi:hypothetical protein
MQIQKLSIGFPVLRFDDVQITYSSPYVPTAFERILITICGKFTVNEVYRNIPLKIIFEDILGVSNPDILLRRTIEELTHIRALQCSGNVDNLDILPLRSLQLTQRGQSLLTNNRLLGVSQIRNESYTYDPILVKLVRNEERPLYQKPCYAVNSDNFLDTFPDSLIQENIIKRQKEGKEPWLVGQTIIERIERGNEKPHVHWKTKEETKFNVKQGQLTVNLPDPNLAAYINALDAKTFAVGFLRDFMSDGENADMMPCEEFEKLATSDWRPIRNKNKLTDATTYRVPVRYNQETIELMVAVKLTSKSLVSHYKLNSVK